MTSSKKTATISHLDDHVDIWSERMLMSGLANFPEFVPMVQKALPSDEVFVDELSKMVYSSIIELYNERAEIKPLSVTQRVKSKGGFSSMKEAKFSLSYDDMTPRTEREIYDSTAGILSLYRRRKAYALTTELFSDLKNEDNDTTISDKVFKTYEALTITGGGSLEKSARESVKATMDKVDRNMKIRKSGKIAGVTTGSEKLDRVIGGWQEDQLVIVAGRPGMGKTSVAVDFMIAAAESGVGVGFISIEMPSEQIMFRMAAFKTGITYSRIRNGDINLEEYQVIETAVSELGKLPIYFYDDMGIKDVRKLEAVVTEWKRRKDIGLVIIDYIQYLTIKSGGSQYDRVTEVSKAIKTMQRNLKIPIIALAQLSRASEGRGDPRPKESDLRDSGQLEQDASIIIGLFNPEFYIKKGLSITDELEEGQPFLDNAYCYYVLKNRDGETCRVDRFAKLGTCKFSDQAYSSSTVIEHPPENYGFMRNQVFNNVNPPF